MKRECAVVKDLLVLYEDDVLSPKSREMVEEHIRTCGECRKAYEKAFAPVSGVQEILADAKESPENSGKDQEEMAVKAISRFRRKLTFDHIIAGGIMFIVLILVMNLAGHFTANGEGIGDIFTSLPAEEIDVKEIYRLKNGEIYLAVSSEKGFHLSYVPVLKSPGRDQDTDEAYYHMSFTKAYGWLAKLQKSNGVREAAYIFPAEAEVKGYLDEDSVYQWSCGEISCVGPLKKDKKVLWKRGEEVPEAPPEIEEKAIAAYIRDGDLKKAWEEMEMNEGFSNMSIYDIYEKYYQDEESYTDALRSQAACEVYEK